MKILYLPKLRELAEKLGEVLGTGLQAWNPGFRIKSGMTQPTSCTKLGGQAESILFVGSGLVNKALKDKKGYPKCWEIGNVSDSFDYLGKIILNKETVENDEPHIRGRKHLEVRPVVQKFDYDCGGAAVSTLLLMLQREEVLKTNVYERLEVNPIDGTKSENIKKLFDEEEIPFLEVWNADLGDVDNILKNGGVILVSYQAWGEPDEIERMECGHYSILFDMDDEFVWLIDPSAEEEYIVGFGIGVLKRPREEFDKLWIDKGIDGTIYEKWMMAVRI